MFRWKGENVSTLEVEANVSQILQLKAVTSYGVQIPNTDGRVGMVAMPMEEDAEKTQLTLQKLYDGVTDRLPSYARPYFVRFVKELLMTGTSAACRDPFESIRVSDALFSNASGTYKLKKNILQDEGFDIDKISDPMYFLDFKDKKYVPLNKEVYDDIVSNKIRL